MIPRVHTRHALRTQSDEAQRFLRELIATQAPEFTIKYFELFEKFGQSTYTAVLDFEGDEFVYVPGDRITLGWDTWATAPEAECWHNIVALFEGDDAQALAYIKEHMSPVRVRTIAPMIVERKVRETGYFPVPLDDPRLTDNDWFQKAFDEVSSRRCHSYTLNETFRLDFDTANNIVTAFLYEPASYQAVVDGIVAQGFRLPTEDEWEYLCGGGSRTLYPWGDSIDYSKNYAHLRCSEHAEPDYLATPNQFGLVIANDPYRYEVTMDSEWFLKSGDGGCNLCGGADPDLGYLPIATYYRHPDIFDEALDYKNNIAGDYTFIRRVKRL